MHATHGNRTSPQFERLANPSPSRPPARAARPQTNQNPFPPTNALSTILLCFSLLDALRIKLRPYAHRGTEDAVARCTRTQLAHITTYDQSSLFQNSLAAHRRTTTTDPFAIWRPDAFRALFSAQFESSPTRWPITIRVWCRGWTARPTGFDGQREGRELRQ